ncbi:hypothetical protein Y1Q_0020946 [Alligator mississippiensis]|uniref:FRAS1-related extracellular matrix protein N-terminal domain-containing protein n=1 Tax=Alligator mississippiensis TaxID=8496 RepID=A0A151NJH0_ALLMI|nr:hypothetical protein Y1Q_0020946 [Alligator mississippiensis]
MVYVTENELQFSVPKERDSCKVEVVLNEPVTQRVGKLTPLIFDCHFLPKEVKYIHNGCPLLEEDSVRLRIYRTCLDSCDDKGSHSNFTTPCCIYVHVIYQSPNVSYSERQNYEVEFQAVDSIFKSSSPTMVYFSIRSTETNAPRVAWNVGLDLLEGQSHAITWDALQIVDNGNLDAVQLVVVEGPQHGWITVQGIPVLSFLQRDLFYGLIYYHHLGGEIFQDSFEFILSDSQKPPNLSDIQTVMIHIVPVKDQLPEEVPGTTRQLVVKEIEIAHVTKKYLRFIDAESPDNQLIFIVTKSCFSPTSPGMP